MAIRIHKIYLIQTASSIVLCSKFQLKTKKICFVIRKEFYVRFSQSKFKMWMNQNGDLTSFVHLFLSLAHLQYDCNRFCLHKVIYLSLIVLTYWMTNMHVETIHNFQMMFVQRFLSFVSTRMYWFHFLWLNVRLKTIFFHFITNSSYFVYQNVRSRLQFLDCAHSNHFRGKLYCKQM